MGGGSDGAPSAMQARVSWYSKLKPALKSSRTFPIGASIAIGRGTEQDIVLDNDQVSPNHARLEISDGTVLFRDLGSTNGSLLNGRQRITQVEWRPGQFVRIANYILELDFITLAGKAQWIDRIRGIRAKASRRSHAELNEVTDLDAGDPAELGGQYGDLRRRHSGINVLGGCCSTDHRHIQQIAAACNA